MNIPRPQFHTDTIGKERVYYSHEPLLFYDDRDKAVLVAPNFCSDGYSIPRTLQPFFSTAPAGDSLCAAVLHDYLYSKGMAVKYGLTRRGVDALFRRWLRIYGVSRTRAFFIWSGVRMGGWRAYRRQAPAIFYKGEHNHD